MASRWSLLLVFGSILSRAYTHLLDLSKKPTTSWKILAMDLSSFWSDFISDYHGDSNVTFEVVCDNAKSHCPPPKPKQQPADRWQPVPLPALPMMPVRISETMVKTGSDSRWESCPKRWTPQMPKRRHSLEGSSLSATEISFDDDSCHSCSSLAYDRSISPPVCPKRPALQIIDMALQEATILPYDYD